MSTTLKSNVMQHVKDPAVAGLTRETTYQPLGGASAAVSPPTYARPASDKSKTPLHAVSDNTFIPIRDDSGWFSAFRRDQDDGPVLGTRVVLDSVGAESGRAETCLWEAQDRLGIRLPALIVGGDDAPVGASRDAQTAAALSVEVSTWQAAHRQNDAWMKFAETEAGTPVWQDEAPRSIKELITTTSARTGEQLYRNFPNSAIYGFWLSSGAAVRHKMPRAYSSEIVGYGAHGVKAGATKLDPVGGASDTSKVSFKDNALRFGDTKGKKPSEAGFGQVPRTVYVTQYVCELILQQAGISLSVLRSIHFADAEVKASALTTLTLLALTGHVLAEEDGFLRTGCALVPVEQRLGWVSRGHATPEELTIDSTDEVIEALHESVEETASLGLAFAEPIRLRYSGAEQDLIAERVRVEAAKAFTAADGE